MDRRVVLTGLAAALAATPALAQTSTGGASSMQGGAMGQGEMQHMRDTMRLGMIALETSRVAQQKAQNAELKGFALFEVAEQETLSEVLRAMMDPQATAAMGQASSGTSTQPGSNMQATSTPMAAMPAMDPQGQQMLQRPQQASGQEFDRMYLEGQLQGHRDLLQVQERYITSNPQNREQLNVAKLARGHIREHVAVLESLQQKMR